MNAFLKTSNTKKAVWLASTLLVLSMLLFGFALMVQSSAAEPTVPASAKASEEHVLLIYLHTMDEKGEMGKAVIKKFVPAGTPLDPEAMINSYPSLKNKLADHTLSEEGFVGMPEDGRMPAEDLTITALYHKEPFTVTWVSEGEIISTNKIAYGFTPKYKLTALPVKPDDAFHTYTFAGWSPEISPAYGDVTYKALFEAHCKLGENATVTTDEAGFHISSPDAQIAWEPIYEQFAAGNEQDVSIRFTFADGTYTEVVFPVDDVKAVLSAAPAGTSAALTASRTVGDDGKPHIHVTVTSNGVAVPVTGLTNSRVTVPFTFDKDPETAVRVYVLESGSLTPVTVVGTDESAGTVTFLAPHFSEFVIGEEPILYDLTLNPTTNGTVQGNATSYKAGDLVTLTVNPAEGCFIKSVSYTDAEGNVHTLDGTSGTYAFTMPSGGATVSAVFSFESYTVTFVFGDGRTIEQVVRYGQAASVPANTDKSPDAQFVYTFSGWDTTAYTHVTGDLTVNALYDKTPRLYAVTFSYKDATGRDVVVTVNVPYGTAATEPADLGKTVVTGGTKYVFTAWDQAFDQVTSEMTVKATYDTFYQVTFQYKDASGADKTVSSWVKSGTAASEPADFAKTATAGGTKYDFTAWDQAFDQVTSEMTVKATYDTSYRVTFQYKDASGADKTEEVFVKSGASVKLPAAPESYTSDGKTFKLDSWSNADKIGAVTGALTVEATYTEVVETESETEKETETEPEPESETEPEPESETEPEPESETETETETETVTGTATEPPTEPGKTDTAEESLIVKPETETGASNGCQGNNWWWIVLLVVIAVAVVVVILYRKGIFGGKGGDDDHPDDPTDPDPSDDTSDGENGTDDEPETAPEAPETAEPAEAEEAAEQEPVAPLFVPLGQESEEPDEPIDVVTVDEVSADAVDDLMTDKVAEKLLEEADEVGKSGKVGIINIGIISGAYEAHDTVDLASLKEKGLMEESVCRLKVLASGTLDKPLTIKADAYSVEAIKMITLTGGHAMKLKSGGNE